MAVSEHSLDSCGGWELAPAPAGASSGWRQPVLAGRQLRLAPPVDGQIDARCCCRGWGRRENEAPGAVLDGPSLLRGCEKRLCSVCCVMWFLNAPL